MIKALPIPGVVRSDRNLLFDALRFSENCLCLDFMLAARTPPWAGVQALFGFLVGRWAAKSRSFGNGPHRLMPRSVRGARRFVSLHPVTKAECVPLNHTRQPFQQFPWTDYFNPERL